MTNEQQILCSNCEEKVRICSCCGELKPISSFPGLEDELKEKFTIIIKLGKPATLELFYNFDYDEQTKNTPLIPAITTSKIYVANKTFTKLWCKEQIEAGKEIEEILNDLFQNHFQNVFTSLLETISKEDKNSLYETLKN